MSEKKTDEFIAGFACCISFLIDGHDQPTIARDAMNEHGFTFKDFKQANIDMYDLKIIAKCKDIE